MGIDLANLKPNVPRALIQDYVFCLYGRPKIGKTSLFHSLMQEAFPGENAGLLLGFEDGYRALKNIMAQSIESWRDFIDVIDQLIDQKDELGFKVIAMDTVDRAYDMCTTYVLKRESVKDGETYKAAGDIPYGKGYTLISAEMQNQISRLHKAGYSWFFITHDQDKKIESRAGVNYDKATVSLERRARDIVVNMSDFIVFIENVPEKTKQGIVHNRWIFFRGNGEIEAGSRFPNIVEKVPYDPKEFIQAFEDAVLKSQDGDVDIEALREKQTQERSSKANAYTESDKSERESNDEAESDGPSDLIEKIDSVFKTELTKENKGIARDFFIATTGSANVRKERDMDKLNACYKKVLELLDSQS